MNDDPKPIGQPPDDRKADPAEQAPALHKRYKEKRKAIRHDPEPDGHDKPKAHADLESSHGRMVADMDTTP